MVLKILIVDDEPSVLKMVRSMFKNQDYELIDAGNGIEALKVLSSMQVDLLITDIVMPEKHGIELIMEVHKTSPNMPVIAISGGGGITGRFDYLEIANMVGANNILRKPFSAEALRGLVDKVTAPSDI